MTTGAIVGAALGGVAVFTALLAAAIVWLMRKRRPQAKYGADDGAGELDGLHTGRMPLPLELAGTVPYRGASEMAAPVDGATIAPIRHELAAAPPEELEMLTRRSSHSSHGSRYEQVPAYAAGLSDDGSREALNP
jgi:hypothetical protein